MRIEKEDSLDIHQKELAAIEKRIGVHERKSKKEEGQDKRRKHIKERKELSEKGRLESIREKNKIATRGKVSYKKKHKPEEKKGKLERKKEMARFVIQQIMETEGNDSFSSGLEEQGKHFLISGGEKITKKVVGTVGNWSRKIIFWIAGLVLKILKWIVITIFSSVSTIVSALWPILLVVLVVVLFVFIASENSFQVIGYLNDHAKTVAKEVEAADEVSYYIHGGYYGDEEDAYMNQDDMLLIFLAKAIQEEISDEELYKDLGELGERVEKGDDAYEIDRLNEERIRNEVMANMLFFEKSSYEKEITVTVAPSPTLQPELPESEEGEKTEELFPTVSPAPVPETEDGLTPTPAPTVSLTPAPEIEDDLTPTPTPETEVITITVDTIDVHIRTAENYIKEYGHKFTDEQIEMYKLLLDLFEQEGYLPGNGSTVCDSYNYIER